MAIYCSNEYCKGRDECQKAQQMQDGDTVKFFYTGYFANRCTAFEKNNDLPSTRGKNDFS